MSYNVIAVDVRYPKPQESVAGDASYPGYLLQKSAGTMIAHAVAGGKSNYFADMLKEKSIADAYTAADALPWFPADSGDKVYAMLTTSQTITEDEALTSNGDGTLKSADNGAIAVGGSTNYVTFTPVGDNFITVAFTNAGASESLAVTINGGSIAVNLATDGSSVITSTPAQIVTAFEAVAGDAFLATAVATGTGVVEADAAESTQADKIVGYAKEAVTTTSAVARILVEVA
jgi:hypothetical protein